MELTLHTFFLIPGLLPGTHSAAPRSGNRDSAVGVAVFGAIVNATLGGSGLESDRVAAEALTTAVHHVFLGTTVLDVAMLAAVLLMPRDRARRLAGGTSACTKACADVASRPAGTPLLHTVASLPSCVVPCACPIDVHFVETSPTVRDERRSWPGGRAAPG